MRKCITKVFMALVLASFLLRNPWPRRLPRRREKPVQDAPAQTTERTTLINVQVDGTDSIGARLSTRLKERFNTSSLFPPEFGGRQGQAGTAPAAEHGAGISQPPGRRFGLWRLLGFQPG